MSALFEERGRGLAVAGLFLALTLLLTWPIPRQIASAVPGFGDSLLNAWILAWEGRAIGRLDFAGFFDTNIFYPLEGTLTYSELMLPQAIFATPAWLASRNPILVFNLVLLASIWTSALAAYLLAMHLTRDRAASFTAGAIFAFCPFMLTHLPQVQTLFAAGIPLSFLFLHRFAESRRTLDLLGFGAVFAVQALGNGYYAVYLALFAGLYLAFHAVRDRWIVEPRFWLQAGLVAGLVLLVVGPFYLQYTTVAKASGFTRPVGPPTGLASYLSVTPGNWLYGRLLGAGIDPGTPGARLFPGVVAVLLAAVGLAGGIRRRPAAEAGGSGGGAGASRASAAAAPPGQRTVRALEVAILATVAVVVAIDLGGGLRAAIGGVPLRATGIERPLLLLAALVLARGLAGRRWPGCASLFPRFGGAGRATYPALLAAAFVFSLGTQPYGLLRDFVPGFGNLRAPYRIGVVFLFALAMLAALGMAWVLQRLRERGRGRALAAAVLPALVVVEFLSIPVPVTAVAVGDEVPAVWRWLAERDDDPAIAVFPVRIPLEYPRVLYSAYHWKPMVNGFSGYAPYLYVALAERDTEFPSPPLLAQLRALGVDLVLVETAEYRSGRRRQVLRRLGRLERAVDGLRPLGEFDGVRVYELHGAADPAVLGPPAPAPPPRAPLERAGWSVDAVPPERAGDAVDGDPESCWAAPMRPGASYQVDLGRPRRIGGIVLRAGASPLGYPRGYRVEVSRDGLAWRTIARERRFHPPLPAFLEPIDMPVEIRLPPATARRLRIVQERSQDELAWVICELDVLG